MSDVDSGSAALYTTLIPRPGVNKICFGCGIVKAAEHGFDAPAWAFVILERAARRKEFVHA
jgi:hypothetical protein